MATYEAVEDPKGIQPQGRWTVIWTDADGSRWSVAGWMPDRATAEAAIPVIIYVQEHGDVPARLEREEYETRCLAAGLTPMSDADLLRSAYGITYAEYGPGNDPDGTRHVAQALAASRLAALRAREAQRVPPTPQRGEACAHCGMIVPASWLTGSSCCGRVCPDCYDLPACAG